MSITILDYFLVVVVNVSGNHCKKTGLLFRKYREVNRAMQKYWVSFVLKSEYKHSPSFTIVRKDDGAFGTDFGSWCYNSELFSYEIGPAIEQCLRLHENVDYIRVETV